MSLVRFCFFLAASLCTDSLLWAAENVASGNAGNETEPLWELGFGAGVLHVPGYPGSAANQVRALALPSVVYRGDILRIGDGQTVRAVAFESNRIELDLSFAAAFNADTRAGELREGMPDLDYIFQVGPQVKIDLANVIFPDQTTGDLTLALQARGVFSTDLGRIDHHGYVFEPMLQYKHTNFLVPELEATLSLKPQWASRGLHAYFFEVAPDFVKPGRPAYRARSGYFGTGLNLYASYRFSSRFNAFFGVQTTSHHGAANTASPLYEKDFTIGFGAGLILNLFASSRPALNE